jgi:voltage-gated potassium channel Kch
MVIMSTIIYTVENPVHGNPDADFIDIPTTFWCGRSFVDANLWINVLAARRFTIVTMTSVGYGDMSPVTSEGQAVASVIMLSGILTLAVSEVELPPVHLHISHLMFLRDRFPSH